MPNCAVCEVELQSQQKTCHVCGSAADDIASSELSSPSPVTDLDLTAQDSASSQIVLSSSDRECPACGRIFDSQFQDEFCPCGTELRPCSHSVDEAQGAPAAPPPLIPSSSAAPPTEVSGTTRPAVGTVCLVVYSETKPRQPIHYVPIKKDVLLIGREDAVRGDFPDLDLGSLLDESMAKKVSRRHAELLRARNAQSFVLRPLPGNTGTQVGKELASPGQNYPLTDGVPIVIGGVVWMKFETIK